jgi:cytochrome c peroxidase
MKKLFCMLLLVAVVVVMATKGASTTEPQSKADLGKLLFFDPILSGNRKISCASCHKPEFAFADTVRFSPGVYGRKGTRNSPSVMNGALQSSFFWDGRSNTLEEQALIPISNPLEMDLPINEAVTRLNKSKLYAKAFAKLFKEPVNAKNLASVVAAFERTLETSESPFDDWRMNDDEKAISASAQRGFLLFNGKANCIQCHFGPDFNNSEFKNIGLFDGKTLIDSGRAAITKKNADLGKFKIGPLRNISLTAPYMHNGMFKTLKEVIEYYNDPDKVVASSIGRDPLLSKPLQLEAQEKTDLENFLRSLTDKRFLSTKLSLSLTDQKVH